MLTRCFLTAAALAAIPGMAFANATEVPTIVRTVKYKPISAEISADAYRCSSPQVFHRRPRRPQPQPTPCRSKCRSGMSFGSPGCAAVKCPEVEVGSIVTAPTNFLGKETGHVLMKFDHTTLECGVLEWQPNYAKFQVPNMGLSKGIYAKLELVRPDGTIVRCYRVCLVPKPGLIVQPVIQASPAASPRHSFHAAETHGLQVSGAAVERAPAADAANGE